MSERKFDLNDIENIIPQEEKKIVPEQKEINNSTSSINKGPDVLILKELPPSIIKNDKITNTEENEEEQLRLDDELLAKVIERQTEYRDEPIKAHYKTEEKKINLSMVNQSGNHPTGKVVNRRTDVDYENSLEIIENKTEKISEDNTIVKPKATRILDYDDFAKQKKTNAENEKRNVLHDTKTLFNFNADKKASVAKDKISKNIDSVLHNSTPPEKKVIKTSAVVFDDLLSNKKLSSISIDEFKNRDKHVKEEIEIQKKIKESENKEIVINQKEAQKVKSFGSLLDQPIEEDEEVSNIEQLKQHRWHHSTPKIEVIKEGDRVGTKRKSSNFFDDLL